MKVRDIVLDVRDLLSNKSCWTQDAAARDIYREAVSPQAKRAMCWCLSGAIEKIAFSEKYADEEPHMIYCKVLNVMEDILTYFRQWPLGIALFNDTHPHDEVMGFLDDSLHDDRFQNKMETEI